MGKSLKMTVFRDGSKVDLNTVFAHRPDKHDYPVAKIVEPVRQKVKYVVIGGVVFMDLALNHIELLVESNPTLINYFRGKHRVEPRVVVSGVLPECTLPEDSVTAGELVTNVNGQPVHTLTDLQSALDAALSPATDAGAASDNWFTVETTENSLVVFDLKKVETRHGEATHELGTKFNRKSRRHNRDRKGHKGKHKHRKGGKRGGKARS